MGNFILTSMASNPYLLSWSSHITTSYASYLDIHLVSLTTIFTKLYFSSWSQELLSFQLSIFLTSYYTSHEHVMPIHPSHTYRMGVFLTPFSISMVLDWPSSWLPRVFSNQEEFILLNFSLNLTLGFHNTIPNHFHLLREGFSLYYDLC